MKMDDYRMTNLVHIDGDERHALIEAFLKARKAIGSDQLICGTIDVFVLESTKPPKIETSKDGMTYKMTGHETVLIFYYAYLRGNECLKGTHNCSMTDMIKFEKSYKRQAHLKKEKQ